MADRTLARYMEERTEFGPYWELTIDRSAAGQPGLLLTITHRQYGKGPSEVEEMTIVVSDGKALLAPVIEWLAEHEKVSETSALVARAVEIGHEAAGIETALSQAGVGFTSRAMRNASDGVGEFFESPLFVALSARREELRTELLSINDQMNKE